MENKPTRYFSRIQEEKVAKYLGGKLTPNSGATGSKKGDILLDDTVIECKTKIKSSTSFTIKKEWVLNLIKECISMGKNHWAIVFDFGTQNIIDQCVVIPLDDYKEYLELKEVANNE